jgi:DNA-binding NarL/FixJ family response regulator
MSLDFIAEGLSNAQIAEHLYLSPRTVEKYVSSLLRKTDTANRAELVRFAMDHHLVE